MTTHSKFKKVLDAQELESALVAMKDAIRTEFPTPHGLTLLGIRTRGVLIAERLRAMLEEDYGEPVAFGILDITLYRDDLSDLGPQPMVRDSEIPFDITDSNIVLIDDVLYTGRTIRSAMDEIIDFGRPALIRLAVLVDRGWHEYPIRADYFGMTLETTRNQSVRVHLKEIDDQDEVLLKDLE